MSYTSLPPFASPLTDRRMRHDDLLLPKVSIIVTNYNYSRFIVQTLRSVARQSYQNWECIVVDDLSTDDSRERIWRFIDEEEIPSGKFRVIERKTNGGQLSAFMEGFRVSVGEFVMMLDSDDILLNDFLQTHVEHHLGNYPVAFTSSNQYQIDGKGAVVSGDHADHQSKGALTLISRASFQHGYWIWATSSSMVFRSDMIRLILPDNDSIFRICVDYYLANFANLLGGSLLIPTIHGCYRRHGGNNFGSHPVLGAINSVGDLSKHPPHDDFRQAFMQHVLSRHEQFEALLTPIGFCQFFLRVATLKELFGFLKAYPHIFNKSRAYYLIQLFKFEKNRLDLKMPYMKTTVNLHPLPSSATK